MLLAEIDPIQIIIIVIAMGAGFVQWLWGLIKQGKDEAERRNAAPLSDEDREAREQAWQQQMKSPGSPNRPSPKTPPPVQDPWATVKDVFEQIKEESRKAQNPGLPPPVPQRPATPPPSRQRTQPGTVRADVRPAPTPPPIPADPFPETAKANTPATPPVFFASPPTPPLLKPAHDSASSLSTPELNDLRKLLQTPANLRQAVLLREILGPPKALQSSGDSAF
ncbi:hypothetical protein GCM10023213_15090 [Prosthecobacter algae]|uniref:Uncharacterized protein n=1 Tax=Prosthecobacter algae TaxID=1144682 RepID=A0ABP9NZH4_9BACT